MDLDLDLDLDLEPPLFFFVVVVVAESNERLLLLAGDANASSFLSNVACLARAFVCSRLASAARCFSSAASAACCFAVAALASDAAAPNISLSNADLAAGSPESSNTNVGHSN